MKNVIIILATLFSLSSIVNAQERTSVGILPFTSVSGATSSGSVNSIQEAVVNAFVKTKRFTIVDRTKLDALKKEKDLQKSEDFIDGSVIQQGISLGANFLISGHVTSAKAERMESKDDQGRVTTTYKAKLSVQLKVIDVATGQIVTSETIEPKSGNTLLGTIGIGASSAEKAISNAINDIEKRVDDFVAENFPVTFPIVEIQEKDGKGNATKILIAGGTSFNLKKGDRLRVVEILKVEVDGKTLERKKDIGKIKITKVEDENFSICSVTSGGIDINAKFEAKSRLLVITE